MSDYTPTTERVRNSYANDIASYPKPANVFEAAARADSAKEEFDRWLASVKAEAWEEGWCEKSLQVDGYEWDWNPYRDEETE